MKKELFHGSNIIVSNPKIIINGNYKDFGYGFYCTNLEKQAIRWAFTKNGKSVVSKYVYSELSHLNIKIFSDMSEDWLSFVVRCRTGQEHSYDIVEGPMADDQILETISFEGAVVYD